MKWHKITEKLAPLNEGMFISNKNKDTIRYAMLRVYAAGVSKITVKDDILKEGDIYWIGSMKPDIDCWYCAKKYPYWLTHNELVKLIAEKKEETDRFEILDIRESE